MLSQGTGGRPERVALLTAAVLVATALVFGGGSRGGGDLAVHLVAAPALALGMLRWCHANASALQRAFLYVLLTSVIVIVVQLLPLPAIVVGALPRRTEILNDLSTAGASSGWLPLTLDRWGTVRALLALMNFAAMWLIASTLSSAAYTKLLQLATCVAIPMVLLGFAQVSGVSAGNLIFHKFQNREVATAIFANRNHFATLLAMLAPLALVFGHQAQRREDVAMTSCWYFVLALLLLGAAMTFSRMGTLLATCSAGVTGVLVVWSGMSHAGRRFSWRSHSGLMVALSIAGLAVANYAWAQIINRFQADPLGDRRWEYLEHGWAATAAYMPWGAGLGSFRAVYASFEPVSTMINNYALHAHNDVLELAIETGVPGIIVLLTALVVMGVGAWRCIAVGSSSRLLGKALVISASVPLVHSLLDYPLRTLAVGNLFALIIAGVLRPWPAQSVPILAKGLD